MIERPVRMTHACARIGSFPREHGAATVFCGGEEEVFAVVYPVAVGVGGGTGIAGLDAHGADPVDVCRDARDGS